MARAGTASVRQLMRVVRWELMAPLERAARRISVDGMSLGVAYRVAPRIRRDEALVTAALAMAEQAATHHEQFVGRGFPPDFEYRLRSTAQALRDALDARALELSGRAAATAELAAAVAEGGALVFVAESMLASPLERDPMLGAEWKSVVRGRGRRRVQAEGV